MIANSNGVWIGADPGGKDNFGLAFLGDESSDIDCATVSSVDEAVEKILSIDKNPIGLGIDAPMWWCGKEGGGRKVDQRLRDAYRISSGTVQSVNSLRGAALVGGALLAFQVRGLCPNITESHPKAFLKAFYSDNWDGFATRYEIPDGCWRNEHERDAIIAGVCAREGFKCRWKADLSEDRYCTEQNPKSYWLSPIYYFWPEQI